jgi:hypothetical protein
MLRMAESEHLAGIAAPLPGILFVPCVNTLRMHPLNAMRNHIISHTHLSLCPFSFQSCTAATAVSLVLPLSRNRNPARNRNRRCRWCVPALSLHYPRGAICVYEYVHEQVSRVVPVPHRADPTGLAPVVVEYGSVPRRLSLAASQGLEPFLSQTSKPWIMI